MSLTGIFNSTLIDGFRLSSVSARNAQKNLYWLPKFASGERRGAS